MKQRTGLGLVLLGWVLLHAERDGDWRVIDDYPSSLTCERVRAARIDAETRHTIGSALAEQPADNPMRQEAYRRAGRRTGERYRCDWQAQ